MKFIKNNIEVRKAYYNNKVIYTEYTNQNIIPYIPEIKNGNGDVAWSSSNFNIGIPSETEVDDMILVVTSSYWNGSATEPQIDTGISGVNWNALSPQLITYNGGTEGLVTRIFWKIAEGGDALKLNISASNSNLASNVFTIFGGQSIQVNYTLEPLPESQITSPSVNGVGPCLGIASVSTLDWDNSLGISGGDWTGRIISPSSDSVSPYDQSVVSYNKVVNVSNITGGIWAASSNKRGIASTIAVIGDPRLNV